MTHSTSSPWWRPDVHAARRPFLEARGRIRAAVRGWFEQRGFVEVETEPVTKGQTASGSYKPAVLNNGLRTMVPTYVTAGTRIVVTTEDGAFYERAKD